MVAFAASAVRILEGYFFVFTLYLLPNISSLLSHPRPAPDGTEKRRSLGGRSEQERRNGVGFHQGSTEEKRWGAVREGTRAAPANAGRTLSLSPLSTPTSTVTRGSQDVSQVSRNGQGVGSCLLGRKKEGGGEVEDARGEREGGRRREGERRPGRVEESRRSVASALQWWSRLPPHPPPSHLPRPSSPHRRRRMPKVAIVYYSMCVLPAHAAPMRASSPANLEKRRTADAVRDTPPARAPHPSHLSLDVHAGTGTSVLWLSK